MNARLLRRGALFGVLLGALACGEEDATTEEPPRWRVLPAATVRGGVLTCAAPVAGQGPQARLTARLEVLDAQGERRYDTTVQQLQSDSVDFPAVPQGDGYTLRATLCERPEDAARYVGEVGGVAVRGQDITEVPLYLLPADGPACPGQAGAPAWPDATFAFAAAVASDDGERALFAGGISGDFGAGTCAACAPGARSLTVLERAVGTFRTASAQLPAPSALARAAAIPHPAAAGRTRLLLLGGATELATFGNQVEALLFIGPAPQASITPPLWLDPATVEVVPWSGPLLPHLTQRFAPGLGAAADGSLLLVAGGIDLSGSPSADLTLLTPGSPDQAEALEALALPRIAPAVVSPQPGIFAVIGGTAEPGLEHLVEVIDARVRPATRRAVTIRWEGDAPPSLAALAQSTALPHAARLHDGRVLIAGGLPFVQGGRLARVPSQPALYTLRFDLPADAAAPITVTVALPPGAEAAAQASRRAFAAEIPAGPDTLLLLGGADPDITQDLRPSRGALEIDLASGEVRDASPHAWPTLGAAGVRLGAGVVAAAGGLLLLDPDDPTSTPGVSNAAVLWADRDAAARRCGPLGDAFADDLDDAGSP